MDDVSASKTGLFKIIPLSLCQVVDGLKIWDRIILKNPERRPSESPVAVVHSNCDWFSWPVQSAIFILPLGWDYLFGRERVRAV